MVLSVCPSKRQPFATPGDSGSQTNNSYWLCLHANQGKHQGRQLQSWLDRMFGHSLQWQSLYFKTHLTEFKKFIYGTRRTQAIIQCDEGHTIKALRKAKAKQEIGGFSGRTTLTGSSHSQLYVEVWKTRLYSVKSELYVSRSLWGLKCNNQICQSRIP